MDGEEVKEIGWGSVEVEFDIGETTDRKSVRELEQQHALYRSPASWAWKNWKHQPMPGSPQEDAHSFVARIPHGHQRG